MPLGLSALASMAFIKQRRCTLCRSQRADSYSVFTGIEFIVKTGFVFDDPIFGGVVSPKFFLMTADEIREFFGNK